MDTKKTVNTLITLLFVVLFGTASQAEVATTETTDSVKPAAEASASTDESKKPKEIFYKCTKAREMRWMRIHYQKNGKCKTVYSKTGKAEEVAHAYSYASCEEILNGIKKNLENGGFSCEEKILMGALDLD